MNNITDILHIIPNLRKGGAERLVIDIIRELSKKEGINAGLILFENKIEYDVEDIRQYIHIIPSSIQLSLTNKNRYSISALQEFIDDFQPDIIHTHLFEAEIVSRTCVYSKAKWFTHCHDNMGQFRNFDIQALFNKKYLTNYYEKLYLFRSYKINGGNHFIAISNDTQKYFENTTTGYHVAKLPNAIHYQRFYNEQHHSKEKLRLINVGALNKNKNQYFLIEVGNLLNKKGIDFEILFLGEGSERKILEERIKKYNLQNNVFLLGAVTNVEDYLKNASIYLHSAKSEAFGLTIIEAMAAGLPVIALDGIGNRDLIEQGKNGYMIFEQDAENFADTIINLWNNKINYQEMSLYAQQYAKNFDIKEYIEKLLMLYK